MTYVVFTDLDGTLVDHDSYSYEAARPAIDLLKQKGIPLIFCTSKTRAELEVYVEELDCRHPFISENGGGIFIPEGYFDIDIDFDHKVGNYDVIELGTGYSALKDTLMDISNGSGIGIINFGNMTTEEVSKDTGLDIRSAELAKMRDYDEAFRIIDEDENKASKMKEKIGAAGYNYTRGGRYWHIIGDNDKGKAVRILTDIYRQQFTDITTIGLGDSQNDLPMLESVDISVLVQKPGGSHDPSITNTKIKRIEGIGPIGWNNAINEIIGR
ncbi:mannosyl-3-phosphoglycerate phosphatase [Methanococcoides methylutens]|uniref:Mannosyl-3-phosphoglycerate phosphatase n=1 Tax=Methanococcoides methylutens MM1 TaxID=1434104 RepID=A0A0E3SRC3_METMT|nr:mannosyl-3-phosphoglycerate phosphatase [Methanococcoides methylutens]AKB85431.1 Putative mannosyl-3-phosphoglycerate phosphatase [Methanococcoides methylutens MM1]